VAKYLLTHERAMIGAIGERAQAESLGAMAARSLGRDAAGRLADPMLRARIAEFEVDEAAFRALMQRFGEQSRAGQANGAFSSALKYYGAELNKRRQELIMAALGSDALEWEGAASNEGQAARDWLRSKANSIEGGTSEVQLNVIAKRILELPGA
jgi:alkylation response protein AidB-like acyl-CoA dehydrogenase